MWSRIGWGGSSNLVPPRPGPMPPGFAEGARSLPSAVAWRAPAAYRCRRGVGVMPASRQHYEPSTLALTAHVARSQIACWNSRVSNVLTPWMCCVSVSASLCRSNKCLWGRFPNCGAVLQIYPVILYKPSSQVRLFNILRLSGKDISSLIGWKVEWRLCHFTTLVDF